MLLLPDRRPSCRWGDPRDRRMTTIAICSAKGAPGVTTLACALGAVWPSERQVVVVECDPSGGDVAARFGLSAKRGMSSLMLDARHAVIGSVQLLDHVQCLPGGLEVLTGPTGAGAARTVDAALADCLKHLVSPQAWSDGDPRDLLLDCGRIQPGAQGQVAALGIADHVLLVVRPTLEALASARWIAESLNRTNQASSSNRENNDFDIWAAPLFEQRANGKSFSASSPPPPMAAAGLMIVGEGPVPPLQAALALGLRLFAVVPEDRVGASALCGEQMNGRHLARSSLVRTARPLALNLIRSNASQSVNDPALNDPALNDPALKGPALNDPTLNDSTLRDPTLNDPERDVAQNDPDSRPGFGYEYKLRSNPEYEHEHNYQAQRPALATQSPADGVGEQTLDLTRRTREPARRRGIARRVRFGVKRNRGTSRPSYTGAALLLCGIAFALRQTLS